MKTKLIDDQNGRRTFAVVFDVDDEVVADCSRSPRRTVWGAMALPSPGSYSRATCDQRWRSSSKSCRSTCTGTVTK
jgi:hypothetical protein